MYSLLSDASLSISQCNAILYICTSVYSYSPPPPFLTLERDDITAYFHLHCLQLDLLQCYETFFIHSFIHIQLHNFKPTKVLVS